MSFFSSKVENKQKHIDDLIIKLVDDYVDDYIDDYVEKFHTNEHRDRIMRERKHHTIKISIEQCKKYPIELIFVKKLVDFFKLNRIYYDIELFDIDKINEKLDKLKMGFNVDGKILLEAFDIIHKGYNSNFDKYFKNKEILKKVLYDEYNIYYRIMLNIFYILEIYRIKKGIDDINYFNDYFFICDLVNFDNLLYTFKTHTHAIT